MREPLVEAGTDLSPWQACRRLADLPHVLFLDSALVSPQGRYSYVAADPGRWLTSHRGDPHPFPAVRSLLAERATRVPELPPFQGGVAGLFGYDLVHHLERLPRPVYDDFRVPELAVGLYDWVLAFDHIARRNWLIVADLPGRDARTRR